MMSDPEGRRRVELASDNITRHIVEISGDIAEEEETNKRRRERADQTTASEHLRSTSAPDEVPPSVRAAMFGKDAVPGRKRRAEDDPDDPRSGVWQNTGDVEDEDDDQDEDDDRIMGEMEFSDDEDEGDPEPVSNLVNDKDDRKLRGGQDESIHEENGQGDQSVTGAIGVPSVEPAGETLGITNSNDFLTEKLGLKGSTPLGLRCLEVERLADELLNVNVPRTMKVALGSGAGDHVAGPDQVGHQSIRASRGSQRGAHFIAANGEGVRNQGGLSFICLNLEERLSNQSSKSQM